MHKNQKGFALLEGLLIIAVLVVLGFLGWKAYTASQSKKNSNQPATATSDVVVAKEGMQEIRMLPSKTTVKLPSGATLMFGNTGTQDSVPDFVFGDKYDLNDTPNYIPIKRTTKTYDKGYQYTLTNKLCHTERKFDIDVEITVVAYCTIGLDVQKASAPAVSRAPITKQLFVTEKGDASPQDQSNDPFLYVKTDRTRLTKTVDGQKVYLEHGEWNVELVTNFGVGKLKYTAEELYAKQAKSITIGGAKVEINITALTCTLPYGSVGSGCHGGLGDNGAIFDQFNFSVRLSPPSNQDVKIVDYQA